jgi:hypothetical protein
MSPRGAISPTTIAEAVTWRGGCNFQASEKPQLRENDTSHDRAVLVTYT